MNRPKIFLTIGGSDPSGGAGIQADIKTATRLGLYPTSVITTLTAQNTFEINGLWPVCPEVLKAQMYAVLSDMEPDAVKIGMIMSEEAIEIIADAIKKFHLKNIVLDPIVAPTLSNQHQNVELIKKMVGRLFPICSLITPNMPEKDVFEAITNTTFNNMCKAYLLKGGHQNGSVCIDRLYIKGNQDNSVSMTCKEYSHAKSETANTHGSGCVLSSAIACFLAQGKKLDEATELAINFIENSIEISSRSKLGKGNYGPILI